MGGTENKRTSNIRLVRKMYLLYLLGESTNFRNDGWTQEGYKQKYQQALLEYIRDYSSLRELGRE